MIIQFFIHFEQRDYAFLLSKHKDEAAIRVFVTAQIRAAIKKEVSEIIEAEFKTISILDQEQKL